jgi:hypothetical protein
MKEKTAQFTAQTDRDLPHEMSLKSSSQSNSSMPEQTPKVTVWYIYHVRVMSQSDITSGGSKGIEWKEVADGNDIWTQTTFHMVSCKSLNTHLLTKHSPMSSLLYGFYAADYISVPEVLMKYQAKNQNMHIFVISITVF